MIAIGITLDLGTDPWVDLRALDAPLGTILRIGALPGGMQSGKASIAVDLVLDDGRHVLAQCSLDHFLAAAAAFRARYGDNEPRGSDA